MHQGDPTTCEEAVAAKSYIGCEYWPTVTSNAVSRSFDFAVAVSNVGSTEANLEITGPADTHQSGVVAPGKLHIFYLPWVYSLKGADHSGDVLGGASESELLRRGAFHLVSDRPVVAYQFNPLEYAARGGPPGKVWPPCEEGEDCDFSYSNDASLLIPTSAMTGTYRVMGIPSRNATAKPGRNAFFAVTATQNGTIVTVDLSTTAEIVGGPGLPVGVAGGPITFELHAGDVAQLLLSSSATADASGSLVRANRPIQLITGHACTTIPVEWYACDHLEEVVMPAETLGAHYVVTRPTGPLGAAVEYGLRVYGNADGTQLTYRPKRPENCPLTLAAGQVVDCGVVDFEFEVTGTREFGLATFLLGGAYINRTPDDDSKSDLGDPSQSFAIATEQYRKNYVFLAPQDYIANFADIVTPQGTRLILDDEDVSSSLTAIAGTEFALARLALDGRGSHRLASSNAASVQVVGYGDFTSYAYPAGLNLGAIAPPPVR